jgi:3-mercaptopyruvate sulfurtransferase SseA
LATKGQLLDALKDKDRPKNNFPAADGDNPIFPAEKSGQSPSYFSAEAKSRQIVDARSEAEFCGTDRRSNRHGGHIPTAKNLGWNNTLDMKTQRFKKAHQLDVLFQRAGLDLEQPITAYCQSGGRSAVMVFAMELMGSKKVSIYFASWGEWGNADDTPFVPGEK